MADLRLRATQFLFFLAIPWAFVVCGPVNISLDAVPRPLLETALLTLNKDSPTHHRYKDGNLINAQKLVEDSCITYRFTFDLRPVCKEIVEPCPREACTVQVKQHQEGNIDVLKDSIQCMYLFPQSTQDEKTQAQDVVQDQQEYSENVEKVTTNNQSVELDHEIQSSGDQSEKPFIAMRAGTKYCPGCPYDLNPKLPGLVVFADQAVRMMDEVLPNDYKHKVFDIIKVTRAVPPSSNIIQYKIIFEMGETDCLKNAIANPADCSIQQDVPIKTCLVTFEEEPWRQSSRRIVKNNCTLDQITKPVQTETELHSEILASTVEQAKLNALEGLRGFLENSAENTSTEVEAEVDPRPEVTEPSITKVVLNQSDDKEERAGFVDKMKEFGEFLEEFQIPGKLEGSDLSNDHAASKDDVTSPESLLPRNESNDIMRHRRHAAVGAPSARNVSDPEIRAFANKALYKFSENSEGPNEPIILDVVEASAQVVAGMLYKIKVRLGTSDCPKGVKENCQQKPDSEIKECLFSVWSRPWISEEPEIEINCNLNQRKKRSLRGSNYSWKMLQQAEDLRAQPLFEDFVQTYDKSYKNEEEQKARYEIFKDNLRVISDLRKYEQGTGMYGITMFADLTYEEFQKHHMGLRPDLRMENEIPYAQAEIPDIDLPAKFDWREHGAVTPVKNQGQCGSCWAFSVTGNVEGQYAIKHNELVSLSEQELVDCDKQDEGCNGGLPDTAYRAIENLGGLELESDYPYDARNEVCHLNKNKLRVQLASAVNISSDESDMAKWLTANGPISIGINANAMQFYVGGVSHPFKFLCNPKNLDHGVLIVGYGVSKYPLFHKTLPYWIVKNSWGPGWGEQGYYRVYRGDGTCGLNQMASSAVVV